MHSGNGDFGGGRTDKTPRTEREGSAEREGSGGRAAVRGVAGGGGRVRRLPQRSGLRDQSVGRAGAAALDRRARGQRPDRVDAESRARARAGALEAGSRRPFAGGGRADRMHATRPDQRGPRDLQPLRGCLGGHRAGPPLRPGPGRAARAPRLPAMGATAQLAGDRQGDQGPSDGTSQGPTDAARAPRTGKKFPIRTCRAENNRTCRAPWRETTARAD